MSRIEEILTGEGTLVYKTRGVSMLPMLRQNRDVVVIERPQGRLKKRDVALYRRGKNYVLHRVIRVCDGGYLTRGDNTYALETVPEEDVLGVLTKFKRDGREISVHSTAYRCYARVWCGTYPLRLFLKKCRGFLRRAARKLRVMKPSKG